MLDLGQKLTLESYHNLLVPTFLIDRPNMSQNNAMLRCVKSIQIRSFFWSVFTRIPIEYREIPSISPYSVRMQENTYQKKLPIWTNFTQCESFLKTKVAKENISDNLFENTCEFDKVLVQFPLNKSKASCAYSCAHSPLQK